MTLQQVAARLGIPERKLLAMIQAGFLPAVRIGTRNPWRVDTRRLEERTEDLKVLDRYWVDPVERPKIPVHRLVPPSKPKLVRPLPLGADAMTVALAAEALRCSWPSVTKRIHDGAFRATKVNRRWQIATEDVEAAVMEKKVDRLKAKRARRMANRSKP